MRLRPDRSPVPFLVMGSALGLLVALAFLQYQWIGQLGEAERDRLRAHLRAAVLRFAQEFNGELVRLLGQLSVGRPSPPEKELFDLAERWQQWRDQAPYPELAKDLYVTRGGDSGLEEIWVYRQGRGFERVAWPERFQSLRARLALRAEEGGRGGFALWRGVTDDEGKTLVAPRWRPGLRGWGRGPGWPAERGPETSGWLIVELDTEALLTRLIPELVDRHFRRAQGFDFQVQILRRADRRVIYRSDPALPAEPIPSPDATAGLLELRFGGPRFLAEASSIPAEIAPPPPGGPLRFEPEGRWQLLVKHRAGSLEAAVDAVRWRNLAISSAILVLMAASLAMLVISAQRAHRLAQLQMEFVAGVSHELRTPLAVICSAGENLADGLVSAGEQIQRYGALIRNEGRRLSEMVEQILTFAGAQAGRLKYHFQPVDIGEVVQRVAASASGPASEAGVTIETFVSNGLPPVRGDPSALSQCLRNLVNNALKYAASGKWVGIEAEAADGGRWIEVRVKDRGPGIPASDLPHIFEPFYRGRNASDAQIRGAGLGLSLAKGVAEAHGGNIRVESSPNQGATFILRLPVAREEAAGSMQNGNG